MTQPHPEKFHLPPRELIDEALDYALSQGLLMRTADARLTHAPLTLYPSDFPKAAFEQAWALADDFNRLLSAMARNHEFLAQVSAPIAAADPFTGRLFDTYGAAREQGPGQALALGLFRSDYLLQAGAGSGPVLRQVEINAIASAFGALGSRVTHMHRYLAERFGIHRAADLPENNAEQGLADAMATAWRHYDQAGAAVLFVVQPGERNVFDQRYLEHRLWNDHGIRVLRRSLAQIHAQGRLDQRSGALLLEDTEIALVYFRAGYTPDDYPGEAQWSARGLIERSTAVKCPSLALQLCGTKKMQQTLAIPGVLEDILPDRERIARIRHCFAGLSALDSMEAVELALQSPDDFVLKPQREGGGNNLYAQAMVQALRNMRDEERDGWILMERIHPPTSENTLLRDGMAPRHTRVVSELGIFAACLCRDGDLLENRALGHLLRTKPAQADEGGVAAGVAVLDSPRLV